MNDKVVLIIAGNVRSLVANRKDLIESFKKKGYKVTAIVPKKDFNNSIDDLEIDYVKISLNRQKINPFSDYSYLKDISKIISEIKPAIVFSYNIKPVIYGSLAAKKAGITNIYSMITGLGYIYTGHTIKQQMLRIITNFLYKMAFKVNKKVFFQNQDDANEFIITKVIAEDKVVLVNGSGINLDEFSFTELKMTKRFNVIMVARLIKDKGIFEYLKAADKIKKSGEENIDFHLMGSLDENPNSLSKDELDRLIKEGTVVYHPFEKDVRNKLASADLVVLPSYREGTPKIVLEAMAMGRPIITTEAPGCRETVINGVNGYLVPVGDSEELAEKILHLSKNKDLVRKMGIESRKIAEEKYDVNKVNEVITSTLLVK